MSGAERRDGSTPEAPGDGAEDRAPGDRRSLLARVPLFRELPEDLLAALADRSEFVEVEADAPVAALGEPGPGVFVVVDGEVQLVQPAGAGEVELSRLGPGEVFGELALLNRLPRSTTVRATRPTLLLHLAREAFREVVEASPTLALVLLEALSVRASGTDEEIGDLGDQAARDPLTGLLNRRSFRDRLAEECDRTRRYGEPFSVVVLDVDNFREINEDLGPVVGDRVLAWIGRLIGEHTRAADSAYRIGGEEFAVICPSSEGEVASAAARRLVDVVAQARPPLDFQLQVTLSAGYASAPSDARRPDALFHLADRALLRAKAEGRNRVSPPHSSF